MQFANQASELSLALAADLALAHPSCLPNMVTFDSKKKQDGDGQNPNSRLQNQASRKCAEHY